MTLIDHILLAVPFGWTALWIITYRPSEIKGFVKHTIIFILLSVLLSFLVLFLIFARVDETYSASNKGALGLLFLAWLSELGIGFPIAFCLTLCRSVIYLHKKQSNKPDEPDI